MYTVSQKKTNDIFRSYKLCQMLADFQNFFVFGFSKKFAIKPLPPHVNYEATLPCETKNATFIILPLQLLQKLTLKFIYFFKLNVIHIF